MLRIDPIQNKPGWNKSTNKFEYFEMLKIFEVLKQNFECLWIHVYPLALP